MMIEKVKREKGRRYGNIRGEMGREGGKKGREWSVKYKMSLKGKGKSCKERDGLGVRGRKERIRRGGSEESPCRLNYKGKEIRGRLEGCREEENEKGEEAGLSGRKK